MSQIAHRGRLNGGLASDGERADAIHDLGIVDIGISIFYVWCAYSLRAHPNEVTNYML